MLGRRRRPTAGLHAETLDEEAVTRFLGGLGPDGQLAAALDAAVGRELEGIAGLSTLTSHLAVTYLDRLRHPIPGLGLAAGVFVTTRGYVAHVVVEGDPAAYGAADVPVLGTLPGGPGQRVPRDLLTRVVRASRRPFPHICAVSDAVWDGYVTATTWRVNRTDPREEPKEGEPAHDDADRPWIELPVVDGLVRFGWVLRQADLHYGLAPERA